MDKQRIYQMINKFNQRNDSKSEAIVTVLEKYLHGEVMDDEDIESEFYDESNPFIEHAALRAMEWLNEEISDDELF